MKINLDLIYLSEYKFKCYYNNIIYYKNKPLSTLLYI